MQEAWVGLSLIALAVVALRNFPPVWSVALDYSPRLHIGWNNGGS